MSKEKASVVSIAGKVLVTEGVSVLASEKAVVQTRAQTGEFKLVPTKAVGCNGLNPRRTFTAESQAELVASIRQVGILQPLVVRPTGLGHPLFAKGLDYEVVAGERRYRAACAAELPELPVMVRTLSDREALEVCILENLQREDVPALEEAEGIERLRVAGMHPDRIAEKLGRSRRHVYARLRLVKLCDPVKHALAAGQIESQVAGLLANFDGEALQKLALKALREEGEDLSYRQAREILAGLWPSLSAAPWSQAAADLVSAETAKKLGGVGGPCGTCPRNSLNMPDMAGLHDGAAVCTDERCYAAKGSTWRERRLVELRAAGRIVIDDLKWSWSGKDLDWQSGWVLLRGQAHLAGDYQRTWASWLKGIECPRAVTISPRFVEEELVKASEARAALIAAGKLQPEARGGSSAAPEERRKVVAANRERRAEYKCLGEASIAAAAVLPAEAFYRLAFYHVDARSWAWRQSVSEALGQKGPSLTTDVLAKKLEALPAAERQAHILRGWVCRAGSDWQEGLIDDLVPALGLDRKALLKVRSSAPVKTPAVSKLDRGSTPPAAAKASTKRKGPSRARKGKR